MVLQDKALLVRTSNGTKISESIPEAEVVSNYGTIQDVFVPWTVQNAAILAAFNAPTVSPIMRGDYPFPSQYDSPFTHQYKIANFLSVRKRAYCFAGMGTGKTYAAAWAAHYLMLQGVVKRVLVICPMTIMHTAWAETLFHVSPTLKHSVLHSPSPKKRAQLAADKSPWHIINPKGVSIVHEQLRKNEYDLIIVDETTNYKNAATARWKAVKTLITPDTMVWGLTGTPRPNGPDEAYGQAKLITPWTVPSSANRFKGMVMYKINEFKWLERDDANDTVKKALAPAIWINKADCLDLPEKIDVYDEVPLSKEQLKAYNDLRRDEILEMNELGVTITSANAAVKATKLLQIASGAVYTDERDVLLLDANPRLKLLPEWIKAAWAEAEPMRREHGVMQGKTLLFVPFRHTLDLVNEYLKSKGLSTAVMHGGVSVTKRSSIFESFAKSSSIQVIIAVPRVMSHGVTATAASQIIWYSPCTSGEVYQQACNRIDRPGQKCSMVNRHLYGSPLERRYYDILQNRESGQDSFLSLYNDFLAGE